MTVLPYGDRSGGDDAEAAGSDQTGCSCESMHAKIPDASVAIDFGRPRKAPMVAAPRVPGKMDHRACGMGRLCLFVSFPRSSAPAWECRPVAPAAGRAIRSLDARSAEFA